jgi:hypothetical protein
MTMPNTSHQLTMMDAILILLLAYRIHGTDAAIKASAYSVRDKVRIACRPHINKVIRCSSPIKWAEAICRDDEL